MMEKILSELRKFDAIENAFGKEFIDAIEYGECADAYVVRVYDYPNAILEKDEEFEENYFKLIAHLTWMKNKYMNSLESGEEDTEENDYCMDWCVFKTNYNIRKAWFYLNVEDVEDLEEVTELLLEAQGKNNYHATVRFLSTPKEEKEMHAYNAIQFVGNSRAIRDLSMKYLDEQTGAIQWQFHLWHNMPFSIVENYGHIFYIGNEMSSLEYCPSDYEPKEYYYDALYVKLNDM